MVTFAKGVAGGFPMGGMIAFGEKLAALFTPGSHGSTFAGNPLGAAAGLATLDVIEDENLVANAEARGEQLRDGIMATGNRCSFPYAAVVCWTPSSSSHPAPTR